MANLKQELAFYRKYHFDPVNVTIHVICIPLILLTSLWLTARCAGVPTWVLKETPIDPKYYQYCNLAFLIAIGYAVYYSRLDVMYGVPTGLLLVWASSKICKLAPNCSSSVNNAVWGLWTMAWVAQFIGHGAFEHRAPALLNSLTQALVLAPFFVVFEVGHYLGLRTEILDSIDAMIKPEVDKFHAARLAKSAEASPSSGKKLS